ncbi:MAG: hypothetical protein ACLSAH_21085 [Bilophila wadsworthia]
MWAGILTDAEALELIECMWIKFGEQICWNEPAATHYARILCVPERLHRRRGHGQARRGESFPTSCCKRPSIHRWCNRPFRAPEPQERDFFLKIAELIQTGSGFPAIYSDEIGMSSS